MKRMMIGGFENAENRCDNYIEAFAKLGCEAFVSLSVEDLLHADGLILPGSSQDMNPKLWGAEDECSNDINDGLDASQWALLDLAKETSKPVLGICRGMQFINVYFGGTLIQDLDCAEYHKAGTPERYHQLETTEGGFMEELYGKTCLVNTRHHQGVGRLGDGLSPAALWIDNRQQGESVVEAFSHKQYPFIGVQWHPERMFVCEEREVSMDGEKLLRHWLGGIK
ncbi:MAG: gamma-glutamyl-gamma-aminobutyrate hydrolase family protein [Emergencia sp.]|nr:gamma-glutamyl-gamma-aminobutyrate hydrolase family protein [Emergencia sp.]